MMRSPEEIKNDGSQKLYMIAITWSNRTMKELEAIVENGTVEFALKKKIRIGSTLPIPPIETGAWSERLETIRIIRQFVEEDLAKDGWKISEEMCGSRLDYYLVKKN